MAWSLVGTAASVVTGAASAAVTGTWGAGQNRTAGNLLVCLASGTGAASFAQAPTGWTQARAQTGTSCVSLIYFAVATGGDAAPTIAAQSSMVWSVQMAEYTGGTSNVPLDQIGGTSGITAPNTATNTAADAGPGDLVVGCWAEYRSMAATSVYTVAFNNGATATNVANTGTSTQNHYGFSYGVTTGNASADTYSVSGFSTSQLTGTCTALASFRLPPTGAVSLAATAGLVAQPYYPPPLVAQGPFTSGTASTITPPLPRSNPTNGNLLIAYAYGVNGSLSTPSGWNAIVGAGTSDNVRIFWTFASSGIPNPTIGQASAGQMYAQVLEFTGMMVVPAGAGAPTLDQNAYTNSAVAQSSITVTAGGADVATGGGELVIGLGIGGGGTGPITSALLSNNAPMTEVGNNDSTSIGQHVCFAYGQATTNTSPTSVTFNSSVSTGTVNVYMATFKPKKWSQQPVTVVAQGTPINGQPVTPQFIVPTTAGNFLVAMTYAGSGAVTMQTNPGGWVAGRASANGHINIWYRGNCGANETPPTFVGAPNVTATLIEVAGVVTSSPFADQSAAATGTTGFISAVNPAPEQQVGELILGVFGSTAASGTMTAPSFTMGIQTSGGGGPVTTIQAAASSVNSWAFGYFVSQSIANPSYQQSAPSGGTGPNTDVIIQSFLAAPTGPPVDVGAVAMSGTAGLAATGALPIASLSDAFSTNGTPDTTKWTVSDTNVTVANQQLQITCPPSTTTYHQLYAAPGGAFAYSYWNLLGGSASIQLVNAGNQGLASLECYPLYLTDETYNAGGKNVLFWYVNTNTIAAYQWVNGTQTRIASAPYAPGTHTYVRIREASGTVYFDYSSNGNTWTNFTTTPDIPHIGQLGVWVQAGTYASEVSSTTCIFDNLNITPAITALAGGSNLLTGDQADFEASVGGWTAANGTIATSTTQAYTGTHSLALTATSTGVQASSPQVAVTLGQSFNFSVWVRMGNTTRNCYLSLTFYNASHGYLSGASSSVTSVSTTGWVQLTGTAYTAPAGAAYVGFAVLIQSAVANDVLYIDTASIALAPGGTSTLSVVGAAGSVAFLNGTTTLVTQPVMGKLQFLTNDFSAASVVPPWQNYGSGAATCGYVGGQLQITLPASSANTNAELQSLYQYDLTGSFCLVNLANAGVQNAGLETWAIQLLAPGGQWYGWHILNGAIRINNWGTIVATTTYSATTHAWLKIRENAGTTYYDYSADGATWTNFGSHANQGVVNGVKVNLYSGTNNATNPASTVLWDNFNLPPPVTASAFGPSGANLLTGDNTEFEGGVGGWLAGTSTSLASSTAQANSGTHSLAITATAAINMSAVSARQSGVVGGQNYLVTGYLRAATTARNCQLTLSFYNASSGFVGSLGTLQVANTTTGWTQLSATVLAPAAAAQVLVTCWVYSAALNEVHYLDSVVIAPGAGAVSALTVGAAVTETASVAQSGTAGMTVAATITRLSSITLAGGAALNISSALVTEIASVAQSATAGMTVSGLTVEVAPVAMSATSTLLASLTYRADFIATTSMTVVGTQITGRRYNLLPSRIYISGAAGAISMFGNAGMTVGSTVLTGSSVAQSASAALTLGTPRLIAAQKMAMLTDNFNTAGTPDITKWVTSASAGCSVTNSGGLLTISLGANTPLGSGAYAFSGSTTQPNGTFYDLTESYAIIQLPSAGNQTDTHRCLFQFSLYDQDNNSFGWGIQNNQIGWLDETGAWNNQVAYSAATFQWLRIREHAGTVYFDYSANGNIWTNLGSTPDSSLAYPPVYLQPTLYFNSQATTGLLAQSATVDNFNLPPAVGGAFSATAGMTIGSAAVTQVASVGMSATTGMAAPAVDIVGAPNLLPLGVSDFEDGTTGGWTSTGSPVATLSNSTAQANTGTHSLLCTVQAAAGNYSIVHNFQPIIPGAAYSFMASARNQAIVTDPVYILLFLDWLDNTSTLIRSDQVSYLGSGQLNSTSWNRPLNYQLPSTAPANAASVNMRVQIQVTDAIAGSNTYLDTINFSQVLVALTGVGSLQLSTQGTQLGTVAMSGTAGMTVSSTGAVTEVASVGMSASTSLTTAGTRTQLATVAFAPVTNLTVGSLVTEVSSVALSGTAGMTVTGTWQQQAGIAMSGTSGMAIAAQAQQFAAVSMSDTTTMFVSLAGLTGASVALGPVNGNLSIGTYLVTQVASVALSGSASLTIATQIQQNASVSQSGTASLTVTGIRILPAAMTMAATTTLSAVGVETYIFTVSMAGTAGMAAAASVTEVATIAMSAQSGLFASIVPVWFGIANLVGTTNMVIGSAVTEVAAVALSGSAVLTVTGTRVQFSPVPLSGTAGLTITASVQQVAAVGLVGTTSMAIAGMTAEQASVSFSGSTNLTVAATVKELAAVALSAATSLTIAASTQLVASVTMSGTASLTLTPLVTQVATVVMAATTHLTVVPQVFGYATLSATASLTVAAAVQELASFAGVATASLSVVGSVAELASVNLIAVSSLTATGLRTAMATVSMLPVSTLSLTNVIVTQNAAVSMSVTASLTMTYQALGVVSMAAVAALVMVAKTWSIIQGQVNMSAAASMNVVPQVVATIHMSGVTSLMIQARMIIGVAPGFTANTSLTVDPVVTEIVQVAMSARASLLVDADVRRKAPTLFDQIQALEGQDPLLVGATGYMDDVFTTRLVSDSE